MQYEAETFDYQNINGYIKTENDMYHKNRGSNSVFLCKQCHQSVHSKPARLKINGYIESINGWQLKYEWVNEKPPAYEEIVENKEEDNIADLITMYHKNGKTVKSIQYAMRANHNKRMKLIDIESYLC